MNAPVRQTASDAAASHAATRWRPFRRPVAEEPDDEVLAVWEEGGAARWGDRWGGVTYEAPGGLTVFLEDGVAPAEAVAWLVAEVGGEPNQWLPGDAASGDDWMRRFREAFQPIDVGGFRILPPWLADATPGPGDRTLVIDPTLAFGTGHHETTRLMLRLMDGDAAERPGGGSWRGLRVADVGAGSAILAIAALKLGAAAPVVATEIDPTNEANARGNVLLSGLDAGALDYRVTPSLDHVAAASCDLVLCNMLRERFDPLLAPMRRLTAPGGRLLLSGFLRSEADLVRERLAETGWHTSDRHLGEGDWLGWVVVPTPS